MTTFASSTNGIDEYTASNFGGAMKGDLIAAGYVKNEIYRIQLNAAGDAVASNTMLFSTVGQGPSISSRRGIRIPSPERSGSPTRRAETSWHSSRTTSGPAAGPRARAPMIPLSTRTVTATTTPTRSTTGPIPAPRPTSRQTGTAISLSNLNDPDDDNDGTPDTSDPFAIDPDNGTTTALPVVYTWENDAPNPGGILNLGFTGLMTNGTSNYENLFDPNKMTAGGAAGVADGG